MSDSLSRRDAIKLGAGVLASTAGLAQFNRLVAQTRPASPVFQAFVTDSSGRRHTRYDRVFDGGTGESAANFTIDTAHPQQVLLGFGAALTEAACTILSQLSTVDRANLLEECYAPAKNNFSVARLCIGASDYSTELYSYDEGAPDPALARFSIDHDRVAVIPLLRQARALRPDLFLFGSPWSPPGWMKYSNSMKGGSIRASNLQTYANYIVRYLQEYAATGINIDAMTIQNEIDTDQGGGMPACYWSEEVEAAYIVDHLGPELARNNLSPQLWILDHNYDLSGRVMDQLDRPKLRKLVKAVAWHGYGGSPARMASIHQQFPEIGSHWTEGGDDFRSKDLDTNWARWAAKFAEILNNGAQSITTWNLALDENGKPNIGPFHCTGLITVNSHSQEITRNGIYWALSHFSRAFVRGSHVLTCVGTGNNAISCAAATRPDGALAVVLINKDKAASVMVSSPAGLLQRLSLPSDSVTTVLLN